MRENLVVGILKRGRGKLVAELILRRYEDRLARSLAERSSTIE